MGSIDCGDKVCYLIHKIVESCVVYLATNSSQCQIPCILDGCEFRIYNGVRCAIWTCESYPTTTSSPTPPPETSKIVAEIVLGILGSLAFGLLLVFLLRKYSLVPRAAPRLLRRVFGRNQQAFDDLQNTSVANADSQSSEDPQPQRDFFSVSLEDEDADDDEASIRFLNVTPPGVESTWHFQSVAGHFTEAARHSFTNATQNLLKRNNYQELN